jgi:tetratricopeptide (TPR) repeat protein
MNASVRKRFFLGAFVICGCLGVLYSVSIGHNFMFDEQAIILKSASVQNPSALFNIFKTDFFNGQCAGKASATPLYYRPLTTLSFALNFFFARTNPLWYNLTNLFLHGAVCLLLYALLFKISNAVSVSFYAALIYAVHPIHTEAVTYLASRGDLLLGAWILGACLLYWNARMAGALAVYAAALLSKESGLLLPLYLAGLDLAFIRSSPRELLRKMAPFAAVGAAFLIFRRFMLPFTLMPTGGFHPREAVLRVLSMGPALLSYAQAVFLPERFKFCQAVNFAGQFSDPRVFLGIFVYALLLAALGAAARVRGLVFFGIAFFLIGLFPSLQLFHFYPEWAEHFLYVPAMGLAMLFAALAHTVLHAKHRRRAVAVFLALSLPYAIFLSVRTWERNVCYSDEKIFCGEVIASGSPYAGLAFGYLGTIAMENGDWEEALRNLKAALVVRPDSAVDLYNLGICYFKKMEFKKAADYFTKAYRMSGPDPAHRSDRYLLSLGDALVALRRYAEAEKIYTDAQKNSPENASAYARLVRIYELRGAPEEAVRRSDRWLGEWATDDLRKAILRTARIGLFFRQGRIADLETDLDAMLRENAKTPWFSEIARLLSGRASPETLLTQYPGFENESKEYILISYCLKKEWVSLELFLQKNKKLCDEMARRDPIFEKELEIARSALRARVA